MTRTMFLGAGAALALTLGGCATTPRYQPPPPDPVAQSRIQQLTPKADLEVGRLSYRGELPPTLAPLEPKSNALGETLFIDTHQALAQFPEESVRRLAAKNVKLCARVEIQRYFLDDLRRQTDAAEAHQARVESKRGWKEGLAYGGYAAGAISAWSSFGRDYGLTYALGTLLPGVANQAIYAEVLDQNDIMVALSLAQSRYWYNQNDFWLESMGQWCPSYMDWVARHGQLVDVGYTAAQPTVTWEK